MIQTHNIHFLSHMYFSAQTEPQLLYAAIRYLPHEKDQPVSMSEWLAVCRLISRQTPRQFVRLFPISKEYDGQRYQSKDYFTTMQSIARHGWDTPIGDAVDFLWDYVNPHTSAFVVSFLCALDRERRQQNRPGLLESFAKQQGVELPSYRPVTLNGKQYMQSQKDGSIVRVSPPKNKMPRWWKIIEGSI